MYCVCICPNAPISCYDSHKLLKRNTFGYDLQYVPMVTVTRTSLLGFQAASLGNGAEGPFFQAGIWSIMYDLVNLCHVIQ